MVYNKTGISKQPNPSYLVIRDESILLIADTETRSVRRIEQQKSERFLTGNSISS